MLQSHRHDLLHFLSQDLQGKQIPTYLSMLAETVNKTRCSWSRSWVVSTGMWIPFARSFPDKWIFFASRWSHP